MRFLMLCREPRLYSCQRLQQACEQRGISLDILDPNRMLIKLAVEQGKSIFRLYYQAGEPYDKNRPLPELLPKYDAVLPRFGTASTEMGCRVLRYFEAQRIKVLNNATAFRLARDKWQSLQVLAEAQITVPATSFAGELCSFNGHLSQHHLPMVMKTLSGSQGVGVMLAESYPTAQSVLETLHQANINYLLQDFVTESKGQDIRAFVIGDRVIAAMQRSGNEGEFRANLHRGGNAKWIYLNEAEQKLAVDAAKAIGLDVAGVDLIRSYNGLAVLEVNASPGLEGIENASGVDIAGLMIEYLLNKQNVPH
ncbi:RimK family alpha-L-glutamate ligase [Actinobacillus genomosp. 1]|uniref:ATP-grasp domain-containing protein n=1 Tax=Actinobacillus genomosp. 1 TaxID=254839 RepID=UPI0024436790|nr:RimK family alpha-L-glutamate ligase [Actinobacillus genomosp. 1]WGE34486.1 RimK family alpha-L-glutamate ligase [Actinobacillus genomosp. 1]WGE36533.1 RimK family alpha-L-glutamate ligase [Actinobacillus genomosp. 1]WGE91879.1 RimK family alpha-L-glutamate ligase [Actinobacillus genomosp. 1]